MGVISRGIKNAFRNTIRTVSITFILGLSIAMSLIMLLALKTVQAKIDTVKGSIGNTISVSPAGVRGFEGGGELLTNENANEISALANVTSITKTVTDRLTLIGSTSNMPTREGESTTTNSTTSLTSSVEAGSFGGRQQRQQVANTGGDATQTFTMPVQVIGTNSLDSLSALSATKFDIVSGSKFDVSSTENIAMLGQALATKNNLSVGQTFTAYDKSITVAGIFDAGNTFANAMVLMPIASVQTLSGQTDQINSLTVQVNSIDNLSSVSEAIKNKLGSDKIDITSSQEEANNTVTPLQNIRSISLYSLIGSLVAGSVIILLTMIMIVRERRREIGVLKAIGSSNAKVMAQFTVESLVLTLVSSVVGIIIGVIFSNPVLKVLVTNSESSSTSSTAPGPGGSGGMAMMSRMGEGAGNAIRDLQAVVDYKIVLYGIAAAVVIAIIGSALPSFFIAKIRPAEVMRAE